MLIGVDVDRAREHTGVVAVYTCDDIGHVDRELPLLDPAPVHAAPEDAARRLPAATSTTSVSRSRWSSPRAATSPRTPADLIDVEYEPLPVVVDLEAAVADGGTARPRRPAAQRREPLRAA